MQQEQEAVEMGGEQGEGDRYNDPGGDLSYSGPCTPKMEHKIHSKFIFPLSRPSDSRGMSAPSSAVIASSRRLLPHVSTLQQSSANELNL